MPDVVLQIEPLVLDGSVVDGQHLKMTAKRYTTTDDNSDGLTLLFTHCVGGHKELWEPTLKEIIRNQQTKDERHRIREAIAFDYQNHGDAAVLNADVLRRRSDCISANAWSDAIASFLDTSRFKGHRFVGIGHSAGAGTLVLTAAKFPQEAQPFVTLVLVEAPMITGPLYEVERKNIEAIRRFIVKGTLARDDIWPDKQAAHVALSERLPWASWDPRVLDLYIEYGLQTVRSSDGPTAVTPKCDKRQEALTYPNYLPHIKATELFAVLCRSLPIHLIWGETCDFINAKIKDALGDASEGRIAASISWVPDSGHMIVQEKPDEVAHAICACLDRIERPQSARL